MVDFQSRDTRRGIGDDDSDADAEAPEEPEREDATSRDGTDEGDGSAQAGFAVVSVGTERSIDQDPAGDAVVEEIDRLGGRVVTRQVIESRYDGVQSTLQSLVDRRDVRAVVTAGGTGVEPDDVTVEAVEPMLDKHLPGFGELLRLLCHEMEGSAVIRTRATAGIVDRVPIFCLPGEADLSRRAASELVVPEAGELAELAGREEA